MHLTEINLAIERQLVLDLKVELQKTKEEAQLVREVAEAEKRASYQLGMEEMQVRLTEELLEVCRDYCNVTWDKSLSVAGVPADSVWMKVSATIQRFAKSWLLSLLLLPMPHNLPSSLWLSQMPSLLLKL